MSLLTRQSNKVYSGEVNEMANLTKGQQELLNILKSDPLSFISHSWINQKNWLVRNGDYVKPITGKMLDALMPYLEKMPYDRSSRDRYIPLTAEEVQRRRHVELIKKMKNISWTGFSIEQLEKIDAFIREI